MANYRVYVEKKSIYNIEAQQLLTNLNQNLHLKLHSLRIINLYDVFNITASELERAKQVVFAEPTVDTVTEQIDLQGKRWFATEPLPGQYDQRADSALQALNLLAINDPELTLTTGKLLILDDEINEQQFQIIQNYYINPLEMRIKDMSQLVSTQQTANHTPLPI